MLLFHLPIAKFCLAIKKIENMRRVSKVQTSFLRRSNSETTSSPEFEQVYPWQREGVESIVDGGLNNTKFQQFF
jgi:hypothetical protein